MAGPGHGPGPGGPGARGGFQKPKNAKRTALSLLGYLTASKLPLNHLCKRCVINFSALPKGRNERSERNERKEKGGNRRHRANRDGGNREKREKNHNGGNEV